MVALLKAREEADAAARASPALAHSHSGHALGGGGSSAPAGGDQDYFTAALAAAGAALGTPTTRTSDGAASPPRGLSRNNTTPYFHFAEREHAPDGTVCCRRPPLCLDMQLRTDACAQRQTYALSHVRSLLLISGPYDLVALVPHFDARGLHPPLLHAIMGGRDLLPAVSPTLMLCTKEYAVRGAV
jgi:hypothetical protein